MNNVVNYASDPLLTEEEKNKTSEENIEDVASTSPNTTFSSSSKLLNGNNEYKEDIKILRLNELMPNLNEINEHIYAGTVITEHKVFFLNNLLFLGILKALNKIFFNFKNIENSLAKARRRDKFEN